MQIKLKKEGGYDLSRLADRGLSIAGRFPGEDLPVIDIGPDRDAIPILELLWDAGFKTIQICQGDEEPSGFGVNGGGGYVSLWDKDSQSDKINKLATKLDAVLPDDIFLDTHHSNIYDLYWKCSPTKFLTALNKIVG
jgi:hypothetical protein